MNRRMIILVAAGAAAIVVALATDGFGLLAGDESDQLTLYGNVDVREVELAFRVGGRIDEIPAEEGDPVKAGQTLAHIDTDQLEDAVQQAEARVAEADAALRRLETGNRAEDVAQAEARVRNARAVRDRAARDYERRKPLVEEGAVSRSVWNQTAAQLEQANAQLAEAEEALTLQRSGAREEDIAVGEAQLASAKAALASARTDLADATLTAPANGTVLTRAAEPGAIVQPGETVMTLSLRDPLRVRAYVAGPDLHRVQPGLAVSVSTDGNPKTYRGQVGYISPRAEFTPKSVETEALRADLVYRLRIVVDGDDATLRQGQPVTVTLGEPVRTAAR